MTDIKRLRELEAKATKGPWYPRATDDAHSMNARYVSTEQGPLNDDGRWVHDGEAHTSGFEKSICVTLHQIEPTIGIDIDYDEEDANTELIAEMRNALPALLDELEAARKVVEAAKSLVLVYGGANQKFKELATALSAHAAAGKRGVDDGN